MLWLIKQRALFSSTKKSHLLNKHQLQNQKKNHQYKDHQTSKEELFIAALKDPHGTPFKIKFLNLRLIKSSYKP
jgi:hypothetical protein